MKPAQPKNTEQATRDRRGLRNRAIYLEVIDYELEIGTIGRPTCEQHSQFEIADVLSRSGSERDIYSSSVRTGGRQCSRGAGDSSKSCSSIAANLKRDIRVAVSLGWYAKLTDVTLYVNGAGKGAKGICTPKAPVAPTLLKPRD